MPRRVACDISKHQVNELHPDLFDLCLSDICLKEVTSIADSLYNIQLLKQFSNEYLNKSFYLTMEDMLYSPLVLKVNKSFGICHCSWVFPCLCNFEDLVFLCF